MKIGDTIDSNLNEKSSFGKVPRAVTWLCDQINFALKSDIGGVIQRMLDVVFKNIWIWHFQYFGRKWGQNQPLHPKSKAKTTWSLALYFFILSIVHVA